LAIRKCVLRKVILLVERVSVLDIIVLIQDLVIKPDTGLAGAGNAVKRNVFAYWRT